MCTTVHYVRATISLKTQKVKWYRLPVDPLSVCGHWSWWKSQDTIQNGQRRPTVPHGDCR